ncbi:HEAT repeat domain-containing protein [Candidatus Electronema sp. PJ]|uniref:HEAT repeat domain-containing protein n=1 Tax=Candidatus Electronema sp. PJ TaxID=3401572 RepID=UPI003AA81C99
MNNLSAACLEPYIGLKPFTEQEKDRFFGRDRETSILLDKIRANRLTLLLAASGVGKSSLLQAGIMPTFRADGHAELIYHNSWAAEPGAALRQSILNHYAKRPGLSGFGGDFTQLSLKDTLLACTLFGSGQQILLLDQFEEFFNYQRFQKGFKTFVEELSAAVLDRSLPACFVFSMREDFALELNAFKPFLPGVFDNYFRLEKLTRDQARLAIEQPLKQIGWSFAPKQDSNEGLLEQVLDDLAKREQERQFGVQELLALQELPLLVEPPHLQIVCQELWRHHRDEADKLLWLYHRGEAEVVKQITHAAYQESGRAKGILETYFLRKIGQFNKKEQVLASAAFDHLVGQRATKVAHPLERLAELTRSDANALKLMLDKLQDCAVLRRQKRGEEFWYELYHDIFSESIDKWNREFKHQQRVKRLIVGTAVVLIAGGVLFAGNNWRANYYGRYLQLSPKESISDRIEVYKGAMAGRDIFHQRRFIHEMPFTIKELEAGRKFDLIIIERKGEIQSDVIERIPMAERIPFYIEAGLYEKLHELANNVFEENKLDYVKDFPAQLARLRTKKSVDLLLRTAANKKTGVVVPLAQLGEKSILIGFLSDADDSVRQAAAEALGNLGDRSVVPELVKCLTDEHMFVREAAVEALSNLGDRSVAPEFVKLLADEDENVRQKAAEALVHISNSSIAPKLIEFLANENENVWQKAAEILGQIGDNSITPELIKILADKNENVRAFAAKALGKLGDRSITPELVKLLTDKDGAVRIRAAEALGNLGDSSVAPDLVKLLADENDNVRMFAAEALGKLGNSSFTPEFIKILADNNANVRYSAASALVKWNGSSFALKLLADKDSEVRRSAAIALGDLGDRSVVPEIVKLLSDRDSDVRQSAAYALGKLGDRSVVPEIVKLFSDGDSDVRRSAAIALGDLGDRSVAPEIVKLLSDGDEFVRISAATVLSSMGDPSVAPELVKLLADKNANMRQVAVEIFGKQGDPSVVPELVKLLADKNANMRRVAAEILGKLGDPSVVPELVKLLADKNANMRQVAAEALGKLKTAAPISKPALADVEEKLHQLENDKATWRAQRDQRDTAKRSDDSSKLEDDVHWQLREYRIGNTLASIDPEKRGIEMLKHPLHHVRQGAVRALAGKADADLIDKIIRAHQKFDPEELPSPFPYTAFQAIDLALWNLEYTGTATDLAKLKDILKTVPEKSNIPGQDGAIQERLEWTIERLEEKAAKDTGTAAVK